MLRSFWGLVLAKVLLCGGMHLCYGQGPVLIQEVLSREVGLHVGGVQTPEVQQVLSREVGFFVGEAPLMQEVFSREVSLVAVDAEAPPAIVEIGVTNSPTGGSVTLDWSSYDQWAVRDVERYEVYYSSAAFSDVTGMEVFATVAGEELSVTFDGLAEWKDHFFAVVAVDGLGNWNPVVNYAGVYVVMPQTLSREVGLFVGAETEPPRELVSREVSLVAVDAEPPPRVGDFGVTVSPKGDVVELDWSSYNQWAVRDVEAYEIYYSDAPIFDVTGMTPLATVAGETLEHRFEGLAEWQDHFFAVVPVDGLGNRDEVVNYSAAYVLMPQVLTREVGLFTGQFPPLPPTVEEPVALANGGFEMPATGGFVYWGAMSEAEREAFGWVGGGRGGSGPALFRNGSAWSYGDVPDGSQGVSLQEDSTLSVDLDLALPGTYRLRWSDASRSGQVNPYEVRLERVNAGVGYSTGDTAWRERELEFSVTAEDLSESGGSLGLTFAGLNPGGGDNSVGIDGVSLSRLVGAGIRPVRDVREVVSREVSLVASGEAVPAAVTGVESGFSAVASTSVYGAIDLDWSGYNEWGERDVVRYLIYVGDEFFDDVSGMEPAAVSADGRRGATVLVGADGCEEIRYVAVVAEDGLGNRDPVVYSISSKVSVCELGDVELVTAEPGLTRVRYEWDLGGVGTDLANFVAGFLIYFDGAEEPVVLGPEERGWTVWGLDPDREYVARLATVDVYGVESPGREVRVSTLSEVAPLAYWRFEEGERGMPVENSAGNSVDVDPVLDASGNGFHLRTWNSGTAPRYRDAGVPLVPASLAANWRCLEFSPNDSLYRYGENGAVSAMEAFTIEASFRPDRLGLWQVIVGRNGSVSGSAPAVRLRQRGDDDRLGLSMVDGAGGVWEQRGLEPVEVGRWYHVVATYDGEELSLWVREEGEPAPVWQGSLSTGGGFRDHAETWTVGRGWWDDGASGWVDGRIDEVRITDEALPPGYFLYAANPYADWLAEEFSVEELADPQVSGAGADGDGDRLSVLAEYALGTDPGVADSFEGLTEVGEGELELVFRRRDAESDPELSVVVEVSEDLEGWGESGVEEVSAEDVGGGFEEVRVRVAGEGRRFVRLKFTR